MCTCILRHHVEHQYSDRSMPPPLRNDDHPNGVPWLTADQRERVNKANELYRITCEPIVVCQENRSCGHVRTQPIIHVANYLVSTLVFHHRVHVQMHHCMFGSSHRKLTRLVHNIQSLHQLRQMCDNQREHEPWG